MKLKTVAWIVGIVAAAALLLALLGRKTVRAEIDIAAPPEEVWAVLTDAERYTEWNPVFVRVDGQYAEGAEMAYGMRDAKGNTLDVTARVVKFDVARELNQFGGMRGILTFDHHWTLEPAGEGTRVVQHEEYRGIGVWFWDPSWFEGAYGRANEALRDRVMANMKEGTP